jgi:pyrimidine deaminase RibD-like protein
MKIAIEQANKCIPTQGAFNVGACLVLNNKIVTIGYSRELPGNTHAEQCCLLKLSNMEVARGATMYTTMEPCGKRLSGNTCCAKRILDAGITRVVQGIKEPTTFIGESMGTAMLLQGGVVVDYLKGFETQCLEPNNHLLK